jgi:membrane glycosyltransferase
VFLGRDSGWNAQNRDDQAMPLKACARTHAMHVLTGVVFAIVAYHISWASFLWLLPIAGALMVSPLVSWASGIPEFGRRLWHWNVFRIPEEAAVQPAETEISFDPSPEMQLEAAE